jgi:hypothetical protein
MIRNKAFHALKYDFKAGEPILIDANVWLYLLPPPGPPISAWASDYSAAFKRLLAAKAAPITDAIIISEYLNRYFRLEYDAGWKSQYSTFKKFRMSGDFKNLAEDAIDEAGQILKHSAIQNTPLKDLDLESILTETKAGTLDFNDAVIVESCRHHGWKLLTNDGDCCLGGIEVITTAPDLLRNCV